MKAKKELDVSRKEVPLLLFNMKNILRVGFYFNDTLLFNKMQTLREELELVRSEKDQLSASMKDVIQGAESYKVRIVLHL